MNAIEKLVALDIIEKKYAAAIDRVQKLVDQEPKAVVPLLLLANIHLAEADALVKAENDKIGDTSQPKLKLTDVPAAMAQARSFRAGTWARARNWRVASTTCGG